MNSVKRELGAEICRGCLTTDRRLSPLANYGLFFTLLNEEQKLEALKCPALMLCWECGAGLRRMQLFQSQVWNAHRLLQETVDLVHVQGLSQLSISHKQDYDIIIEDELDYKEEPLVISFKEDETKEQIETLDLNFDQGDNHVYVDTDIFESHDKSSFSLETPDNYLEETINTPQKKTKHKLKRVRQPKSEIKKIEINTNTNKNKSNKASLRNSRGVIPSLCQLSKNKNNTKVVKTKCKVNNTIKRKGKEANSKKPFIEKKGQIIIEVKKENKTSANSDVKTKDTRNEVVIDVKEAYTKSGLENAEKDDRNRTEKIELEINNFEQNDDDSKTDSENHDDPDFEEELENNTKIVKVNQKGVTKTNSDNNDDLDYEEELGKDTEIVKVKQKGMPSRDSVLYRMCINFDITVELDEYFIKVDLSPEEVGDILNNELSYTSEELPYSCHYCGMCYQLQRTLTKHMSDRHKLMAKCKNPVYLMYRCNICHKTVRKEHTEAHMKYLHRFRYSCKECDQPFWDKEEGQSHYKEAHKAPERLKCGVCDNVFKTRKGWASHVRDRHTPHPCDICNKILKGLEYLQKHRMRHADGSIPEQRYCVPCDKQFVSVGLYQMHLKNSLKHIGQPPRRFPCTECGRVLARKLSLKYHFERFHGGKTKFHCPHCDKYFARNSSLKGHIKSAHLKKKPPKDKLCSICGRGFAHTRILTHHMRTHTGERPHVCPHCPAAFAQPYPLQKHLATQHPEAPKTKA